MRSMSIQQELAEKLRESLEQEPPDLPPDLFELRDADVVDVMNQLTVPEAAHTLKHLPTRLAIRLCDLPDLSRRAPILEQVEPSRAAEILEALSADERAYILRRISPHEQHRLLPALSKLGRAEVELLLQYPPKTAGGIMTTELVSLDPSMTVGQ